MAEQSEDLGVREVHRQRVCLLPWVTCGPWDGVCLCLYGWVRLATDPHSG